MLDGLEIWNPSILIAGILLLAGFVQSAIGFGFGITALAMLPLVMDARSSHILISASSVPVLASAAWKWRGDFDWTSLRFTLLGAVIFMPIGLWLFGAMSIDLLTRVTGVAIIAMVLLNSVGISRGTKAKLRTSSFLAGGASGFLSGAVSIAGPPIAAYAIKQPWSPRKFKAFVVQCLLPISIFRFTGLLATGFITQGIVLQSAQVVPFAIAGIFLGTGATRRIRTGQFRIIVGTSLTIVACLLVVRGSPAENSSTISTQSARDITHPLQDARNPEQ